MLRLLFALLRRAIDVFKLVYVIYHLNDLINTVTRQ